MTDEEWKIAGLTYTVEPMGCEKLGQPARRTVRQWITIGLVVALICLQAFFYCISDWW